MSSSESPVVEGVGRSAGPVRFLSNRATANARVAVAGQDDARGSEPEDEDLPHHLLADIRRERPRAATVRPLVISGSETATLIIRNQTGRVRIVAVHNTIAAICAPTTTVVTSVISNRARLIEGLSAPTTYAKAL